MSRESFPQPQEESPHLAEGAKDDFDAMMKMSAGLEKTAAAAETKDPRAAKREALTKRIESLKAGIQGNRDSLVTLGDPAYDDLVKKAIADDEELLKATEQELRNMEN